MAYNKSIGTFYGYANGSKYGRYTCTLYWDNVTRKGTQITMNNAYVEMTRYSTAYTTNRIAGKAGIGGSQTNIANNKTLNAYGTQSPATIKFDLGDPVLTTTGTSFSLYIAIASTGGSSSWENFQSTILEATVDISCPSANPTFITKPSITNIEETKLTLNHGTTDIESLFYYKESKNTEWIEMTSSTLILNGLTAATEYSFDFKAVNKTSTDLGKEVSKNEKDKTVSYDEGSIFLITNAIIPGSDTPLNLLYSYNNNGFNVGLGGLVGGAGNSVAGGGLVNAAYRKNSGNAQTNQKTLTIVIKFTNSKVSSFQYHMSNF